MSTETQRAELPPLPKAVREMIKTHQPAEHNEWTVTRSHYTADQMREYARTAQASQASEIEALRKALQVIAAMPIAEQDNMISANMRKIAVEHLQ